MEQINKGLKIFSPIAAEIIDRRLVVVMNERQVTSSIYNAVIKSLCGRIWFGNTKTLDGVDEIIVLNKFAYAGFLFEGSTALCDEIGTLKTQETSIYILGHSRSFINR